MRSQKLEQEKPHLASLFSWGPVQDLTIQYYLHCFVLYTIKLFKQWSFHQFFWAINLSQIGQNGS